ncbi:preprotein translocase subunit SecE [Terrilactibacillus sp. BCM23-1]|uniref:Protein translocase subunit SecE n=1 Tax=Terrilactibacillus tamarindi TaxID=2599694 RepID=A0A6N8CUF2_9BACI|nr:preprotein translocase subunit SecE [Terrilactibacillus tamarindi]MTT32783.1 preprotein translocase subunit SecE [Terrilactibacillus tamarindi]
MASIVKGTGNFFKNIGTEMKKVSWPTRKEMVNYTITVIVTVVFLTVFFAVVDLGVSRLLKLITG